MEENKRAGIMFISKKSFEVTFKMKIAVSFFVCLLLLVACQNRQVQQESSTVETQKSTDQSAIAADSTFELIKQYPVIEDTAHFISQLRQTCNLDIEDHSLRNLAQKITYYKNVKLNGSENQYILLEYDFVDGSMASYPWKCQLLFTPEGKMLKQFSSQRVELLNMFPDQPPFLLCTISTAKGNGGHELYKFTADTLENVYEGYYDYNLSTYDAHEDNSVFEPNELNIKVVDKNKDGYNDLVFSGTLVLLEGRTKDGVSYNELVEDGKVLTSYSITNPFKKIPIEYVFLFDKRSRHFKAKEDYEKKHRY